MLVVSRYSFPVSVAQGVALFGEASQVGYGAYLLGADTLRGFVNSLGFFCRLRACVSEAHVLKHECDVLFSLHYREASLLLCCSCKLVVESVCAHDILFFSVRHDVKTLSRSERYVPVVFRHAGDDVVSCQFPVFPDIRVLYPDICVHLVEAYSDVRILHKERRVGLAVAVHDFPLIHHDVLYGERR